MARVTPPGSTASCAPSWSGLGSLTPPHLVAIHRSFLSSSQGSNRGTGARLAFQVPGLTRRCQQRRPELENSVPGTPRWTGLSTMATCQLEKPKNSQLKTWGSASTLGVELGPARCPSSNRRERKTHENLRNVADTSEVDRQRSRQRKAPVELERKSTGSPAWIRTTIHGSKGRCPTIRRPGI
jgi:hypothetical protein